MKKESPIKVEPIPKQIEQIKKYNKWESTEIGRLLYCLWELYENDPNSELVENLL